MKRVLFIQNGEYEVPGLFGAVLEKCGVHVETAHAWRGDSLPVSLEHWHGIAIGGGSMSAYGTDQYPFLKDELAILAKAREQKMPVLGMCLGAQLMAAAYGGRVFPNHTKEIGCFDLRFTAAAENDPLWQGHTRTFQPVSWHGDTFSLPPGAVLLASSDITPNQLFRLDDSLYGFQFHLEIGRELLADMIREDAESLRNHGVDPHEFLHAAGIHLPEAEKIAGIIFRRWASLIT